MANKPKLEAKVRDLLGRKTKSLRKQGILPANIYGNKVKSTAIQLDLQEFQKVFSESGETTLIDLVVGSKTNPVLISNVQLDPITSKPIHADFRQVDLTQKVTTNVPLVIIGESPAVKDLGGVLETPLSEVELEALPTDLPEKIEIDISSLGTIGDTLSVKNIKVSSKLTIKSDPNTPVVVISEPKKEEEPEVEPETPEEGEDEATEKPADATEESTDDKKDDRGDKKD